MNRHVVGKCWCGFTHAPETVLPRRSRYLNGSDEGALLASRDEYRQKAPTLEPELAEELLRVADDIDAHLAWLATMRATGVL